MKFKLSWKQHLGIGLLAAGALLALGALKPAHAAQAYMCQGDVSGASTGARTIGGLNSAVPSQTLYTLNPSGCALIAQGDIGYFLSQGYVQGSSFQSVIFSTGVWTGTTDFMIATIPAGAYIRDIIIVNTTANAVTGNISIGTTANGTDVVASQACAANCQVVMTDALTLKRSFPATQPSAAQPIHAAPITAGNNANVTFTIVYGYF